VDWAGNSQGRDGGIQFPGSKTAELWEMGRGSENTLRIDEPLHFMFLVAYLITYFCCAYLLVSQNLLLFRTIATRNQNRFKSDSRHCRVILGIVVYAYIVCTSEGLSSVFLMGLPSFYILYHDYDTPLTRTRRELLVRLLRPEMCLFTTEFMKQ